MATQHPIRPAKPDKWDRIHYPDISASKNEMIRKARRLGFCEFWPSGDNQGAFTCRGARDFLNDKRMSKIFAKEQPKRESKP